MGPRKREKIRKLEKAYEELKSSDKIKNEFFTITLHELKTPLASTLSLVELMLDGKLGGLTKEQKEALEIISQELQRLRASIDKIMEISKLESKEMELRLEKLQLRDLIQNTIKSMEPLATKKRIILTQKITKLPLIRGDRGYLRDILINLINNAIKFTPEGGKVSIETEEKKDHILVKVKDTGIGIATENIPKLFTKGFQANYSASGMGLGLSICKKLVDAHGGEI